MSATPCANAEGALAVTSTTTCGAAGAGGPPEGGHRVLLGDVHHQVGAEALGRLEARVVALAGAGDHHELRAGSLAAAHARQPADARARAPRPGRPRSCRAP